MAITIRNTWNTFTAGDTERITGVSTGTQRDWRRRGFLQSKGDGWTQYDLMDLAQLAVMNALQERGIGPSTSSTIAKSAALRLAYYTLSWIDSIEDKSGGEFEKWVAEGNRPRGGYFVGWTNSPGDPAKYLVAWADGTVELVADLAVAFGGSMSDAKYGGAIIVLDLEAIGTLIVERAGRPLVTVEIAEKEDAQ